MQRTALITGASSGIGLELAHLFAKDNYDLVLVARRTARLKEIKKELESHSITVHIFSQDLTEINASKKIISFLNDKKIHIHTLINNAGFGVYGTFDATPMKKELDMIQLNITALTELTKLLLPNMKQHKSGQIMNVASTAAFQAGPKMAIYFASKAYVLSFSEALHNELKPHGIHVSALCPGPTKTEFETEASTTKNKLKFSGTVMSAKDVARIGYIGLHKGKAVIIPGFKNKFFIFISRFASRPFVTKITGKLMD